MRRFLGLAAAVVLLHFTGCAGCSKTPVGEPPPPPPPECADATGCPAASACGVAVCADGTCGTRPTAAGEPCDDGNADTVGDACDGAGTCAPGGAPAVLWQAGRPSLFLQPASGAAFPLGPEGTGNTFHFVGALPGEQQAVFASDFEGDEGLYLAALDGSNASAPKLLAKPESGWALYSPSIGGTHVYYLAVRRASGLSEVQLWAASLTGQPNPHPVSPVYMDVMPRLYPAGARVVFTLHGSTGYRVYSALGSGDTSSVVALGPEHELLDFAGINPNGDVVYFASDTDPTAMNVFRATPGTANSEFSLSTRQGLVPVAWDSSALWIAADDYSDNLGNTLCLLRTDLFSKVDPCVKDSNPALEAERYGPLVPPGGYTQTGGGVIDGGRFRVVVKLAGNNRWVAGSLNDDGTQKVDIIVGDNDGANARVLRFLTDGPSGFAVFWLQTRAVLATKLAPGAGTNTFELVAPGRLHKSFEHTGANSLLAAVVTDQNRIEFQRSRINGGVGETTALPLTELSLDEPLQELSTGALIVRSARSEKWPLLLTSLSGSLEGAEQPIGQPAAGLVLHAVTPDKRILYSTSDAAQQTLWIRPWNGGEPVALASAPEAMSFLGVNPTGTQVLFATRSPVPGEWEVKLVATDGSDAQPVSTGVTVMAALPTATVKFSADGALALLHISAGSIVSTAGGCVVSARSESMTVGGAIDRPVQLIGLTGTQRGAHKAFGPSGLNTACGFLAQGTRFFFHNGTTGYLGVASLEPAIGWAPLSSSMKSGCDALSPDATTLYYPGQDASTCGGAADVLLAVKPEAPIGITGVLCAPQTNSHLTATRLGVLADLDQGTGGGKRYFLRAGGEDASAVIASAAPAVGAGEDFVGLSSDGEHVLASRQDGDAAFAYARPTSAGSNTGATVTIEQGQAWFVVHSQKPSLVVAEMLPGSPKEAVTVRLKSIPGGDTEASWQLPAGQRAIALETDVEGLTLGTATQPTVASSRRALFRALPGATPRLVTLGPTAGPNACGLMKIP